MASKVPFYRFLLRRLATPFSLHRRSSHASHAKLPNHPPLDEIAGRTLVADVEGGLLRSASLFPYFMLVALEAGGLLRGLILLLLYPVLCFLSREAAMRAMVMVSFIGIRVEGFRAGRAVLPKFFMEDVGLEGFEVLRKAKRRVCVSGMPRVMVEGFLKEYLEVEVVVGRELMVFGGIYTGFMEEEEEEETKVEEVLGLKGKDVDEGVVGFGSYNKSLHHHYFSYCKEVYKVSESERRNWHPLPPSKYPKPLVFHDGRLAFRPTPAATLTMFIWLPFGVPLAIFRVLIFMLLPYTIAVPIAHLTGIISRTTTASPSLDHDKPRRRGRLYVCNHRTLIDPVYVSTALSKPLTAVTYSVSPMSEFISPIRTQRLTRNKEDDKIKMGRLLAEGDLVVCPEGTTCREPYLLRFSPLFAELTDEVVPVGLVTRVGMFYGTTASGFKGLDPFYFLLNPRPEYEIVFLEEISTAGRSSVEVANHVQSVIGRALGFECTALTRKDKYLMLAGNDGIVDRPKG